MSTDYKVEHTADQHTNPVSNKHTADQHTNPVSNKHTADQHTNPVSNKHTADQHTNPVSNKHTADQHTNPVSNKHTADQHTNPVSKYLVNGIKGLTSFVKSLTKEKVEDTQLSSKTEVATVDYSSLKLKELALVENISINISEASFKAEDNGFEAKLKINTSYDDYFWSFLEYETQWFQEEIKSLVEREVINPFLRNKIESLGTDGINVSVKRGSIDILISFVVGSATIITAYPAIKEIFKDVKDPLNELGKSIEELLLSLVGELKNLWAEANAYVKNIKITNISKQLKDEVLVSFRTYLVSNRKSNIVKELQSWRTAASDLEKEAFYNQILTEAYNLSLQLPKGKGRQQAIYNVVGEIIQSWLSNVGTFPQSATI
jgi:hypothetical protein